jgi:hypothetical protein
MRLLQQGVVLVVVVAGLCPGLWCWEMASEGGN